MRRTLVAALLALLCPILIGFVLLMPIRDWPRVGAGLFGMWLMACAEVVR